MNEKYYSPFNGGFNILKENQDRVFKINSSDYIGIFNDGIIIYKLDDSSRYRTYITQYKDLIELAELREIERFYTVRYYDVEGKKQTLIENEKDNSKLEYEISISLINNDYLTIENIESEKSGLIIVKEINKYFRNYLKEGE